MAKHKRKMGTREGQNPPNQAKCECDMGHCPKHSPMTYARDYSRHFKEIPTSGEG